MEKELAIGRPLRAKGSCRGGHGWERGLVSRRTRCRSALHIQPTHDLEQAGMIRQSELISRPGDVPSVSLQSSKHDLPLSLQAKVVEAAVLTDGPDWCALVGDVGRDVLGSEHLA